MASEWKCRDAARSGVIARSDLQIVVFLNGERMPIIVSTSSALPVVCSKILPTGSNVRASAAQAAEAQAFPCKAHCISTFVDEVRLGTTRIYLDGQPVKFNAQVSAEHDRAYVETTLETEIHQALRGNGASQIRRTARYLTEWLLGNNLSMVATGALDRTLIDAKVSPAASPSLTVLEMQTGRGDVRFKVHLEFSEDIGQTQGSGASGAVVGSPAKAVDCSIHCVFESTSSRDGELTASWRCAGILAEPVSGAKGDGAGFWDQLWQRVVECLRAILGDASVVAWPPSTYELVQLRAWQARVGDFVPDPGTETVPAHTNANDTTLRGRREIDLCLPPLAASRMDPMPKEKYRGMWSPAMAFLRG